MKQTLRNGISIGRYNPTLYAPRKARSTAIYPDEANPLYRPAIRNGLRPDDFILNGIVCYLPSYALKGSTFKSVDRYKHTCTVLGALKKLYGRLLDGVDDIIKVAHHAALAFTTESFTISTWIYPDDLDTDIALVSKGDTTDGYWGQVKTNGAIWFSTNDAGGAEESKSTAGDIVTGAWQFITTFKDGASVTADKNGVALTMATSATHTDIGATTSDVGIGLFIFGGSPLTGRIGETFIYNRKLSVAEDLHNCNVIRWRYQ